MRSRAILVVVALLLASCARPASGTSSSTASGFLDWLARNPSHFGLAAYEIGDEAHGIFHDRDNKFPLASTRKVLILGAYAQEVKAGKLRPDERVTTSAIERWYWPNTDGGAHPAALADLRARGLIDSRNTLRLDDIAWAMIRWSDNASADYLLERVGGSTATSVFAAQEGMARQDPLMPIFGEHAAWDVVSLARWTTLGPAGRARRGTELAMDPSWPRMDLHEGASVFAYVRLSPAGTPRDWAHLMSLLYADQNPEFRRTLEWPLVVFASNRTQFDRFGAKGGDLPGVITEAWYIQPKRQRPRVEVLFIRDLASDDWIQLRRTFVDQQFMLKLAQDSTFREKVRSTLGK